MAVAERTFIVSTRGRGTYDVTSEVAAAVRGAGIAAGMCLVSIRHTSASLIVCENADPSVRSDLERFFARLVPDGDPLFEHDAEGDDDMPAHVRSVLTQTSIALPIRQGALALGGWQGIYLYEHRKAPHSRTLDVTIVS